MIEPILRTRRVDARASAAMSALHCETSESIRLAEPSGTTVGGRCARSTKARYDGTLRDESDPALSAQGF